jgi:hypothetical protein
MIRFCNGFDPNLTDSSGHPCRCGLVFDDVAHSTVYPHQYIPTREEKEKLMDVLAAEGIFDKEDEELLERLRQEEPLFAKYLPESPEELLEQLHQRFREEYEQELGPE